MKLSACFGCSDVVICFIQLTVSHCYTVAPLVDYLIIVIIVLLQGTLTFTRAILGPSDSVSNDHCGIPSV